MSFENPWQNAQSNEPEKDSEKKENSSSGLLSRLKKAAALAGVAGLGFGAMSEGVAAGAPEGEKSPLPNRQEVKQNESRESNESFSVLFEDKGGVKWGVEHIAKKHEDGSGYLAERYVKISPNGESTILGEYNNVREAAEGISIIPDVPEQIVRYAGSAWKAVRQEREFQGAGFTEHTGNPKGPTHIEERNFEGYGVKARNTVEVDGDGKVVKVIDSVLDKGKK